MAMSRIFFLMHINKILLNKCKCRPSEIKRQIAIFDLIYLQFRILEIMNEMIIITSTRYETIGFIYKTK